MERHFRNLIPVRIHLVKEHLSTSSAGPFLDVCLRLSGNTQSIGAIFTGQTLQVSRIENSTTDGPSRPLDVELTRNPDAGVNAVDHPVPIATYSKHRRITDRFHARVPAVNKPVAIGASGDCGLVSHGGHEEILDSVRVVAFLSHKSTSSTGQGILDGFRQCSRNDKRSKSDSCGHRNCGEGLEALHEFPNSIVVEANTCPVKPDLEELATHS